MAQSNRNPLSQEQIDFMRLIARSPVDSEGWRNVSRTLWENLVPKIQSAPLFFEFREHSESGQVRLTKDGETMLMYMP